jgi:hypothetical protein
MTRDDFGESDCRRLSSHPRDAMHPGIVFIPEDCGTQFNAFLTDEDARSSDQPHLVLRLEAEGALLDLSCHGKDSLSLTISV